MKIARLGTAFVFAIGSYGFSAAGVAAAPVPNSVASEPAPQTTVENVAAPQWRAGSTWEYSDGYALRVRDAKDGVTVFDRLDAAGEWFSMRGFLRQDAGSPDAERQTIYRTVAPHSGESLSSAGPLAFRREYLSNGELIVHASSWSVEGRERITVPAGTFDCWVIVWRERSLKSNWTGFERWWYSPEAQQYVRLEYKYGIMEPASRVLMRYRLAPGIATAVPATPVPAVSEPPIHPILPAPVDAVSRELVTIPPAPEIPVRRLDPVLVPLSRKEPERAAPTLKQIPMGFTPMSPMFIPALSDVALDEPRPLMLVVAVHRPSPPPLRAVAMTRPVLAAIAALPMAEVAAEPEARPAPLEIAMPPVAMDGIETPPMVEVAIEPEPQQDLLEIPLPRIAMGPIETHPLVEVAVEPEAQQNPLEIPLPFIAMGPIETHPLMEVALETKARTSPREIAMPPVALDQIEAPPMVEVALDAPQNLAAEQRVAYWLRQASRAIELPRSAGAGDMRKRVIPYNREPLLTARVAVAPKPAAGNSEPFGFFGRIFRAILRIFY